MALRKNHGKRAEVESKVIPFHRPSLTGKELACMADAIGSEHWQGDGPYSEKCSRLLSRLTGSKVFLTSSGTSALELAFMSLGFEAGDEVIVPSFTFVSSANALVQMNLTPVFVDVRGDTLNIDESLIEQAITKRTRALLIVHYAGISAEMDRIAEIAKKHELAVVEDAAQGVNAFYKDRALGSMGDLGVFSFHQTKNFACGEGGAIVVGNSALERAIEIHRQKGTDRSRFFRGEIDKYSWIDRGSNYVLSDLLAAVLYPQLEAMDEITGKRRTLYRRYEDLLRPFAGKHFQLPVIPADCRPNYHIFYLLLNDKAARAPLISFLRDRGIQTASHFTPLHLSAGGKRFGVARGSMTVTEKAGANLLRLPLYPQMTFEEQDHVIKCVGDFFHSR